ncbi:TrbI/VirB10 family protein [Salmonella enterica subsp. enterica]
MAEDKEDFKTAAELEKEARERIRADIQKDVPDDKPAPGQPIVVKHQKAKSKRTLFVCIFSLLALIGLAVASDYLMGMLKKGDDAENTPPAEHSKGDGRERKNLGNDADPLSFMQPEDKAEAPPSTEATAEKQPPALPAPPSFNKASALAGVSSGLATGNKSPGDSGSGGSRKEEKTGTQSNIPGKPVKDDENSVVSVTGVKKLELDPNLFIPVDRYIPCSMMRRFVSDIGGNISCLISQDVYSANNHVKLIPAGTVARGVYRSGTLKHGQSRLFIAWTELRTPDHLIIPLVDTQATGQLGENGIAGWLDTHFWERFGNAMMLSIVDDVAAAIADNVPSTDDDTDYTENSREAMADMAKSALENSINIPPTMYLNQGDVISIMTGSDIDFSGIYKLRLR